MIRTQATQRGDFVRMQQEGGIFKHRREATEEINAADLGLLASRMVRKEVSVV